MSTQAPERPDPDRLRRETPVDDLDDSYIANAAKLIQFVRRANNVFVSFSNPTQVEIALCLVRSGRLRWDVDIDNHGIWLEGECR